MYVFTLPISMLFTMGIGLCQNIFSIIILRFFCGFIASPALVVAGGSISDLWDTSEIGTAMVGLDSPFSFRLSSTSQWRSLLFRSVAANNLLRYIMASVLPLFVTRINHKRNISWASSLFGFVALFMVRVRFLFEKYRAMLRTQSKCGYAEHAKMAPIRCTKLNPKKVKI